jgi:hypothetical protein
MSRDNLANTGYCFKQHSNLLTCFELCKKKTWRHAPRISGPQISSLCTIVKLTVELATEILSTRGTLHICMLLIYVRIEMSHDLCSWFMCPSSVWCSAYSTRIPEFRCGRWSACKQHHFYCSFIMCSDNVETYIQRQNQVLCSPGMFKDLSPLAICRKQNRLLHLYVKPCMDYVSAFSHPSALLLFAV